MTCTRAAWILGSAILASACSSSSSTAVEPASGATAASGVAASGSQIRSGSSGISAPSGSASGDPSSGAGASGSTDWTDAGGGATGDPSVSGTATESGSAASGGVPNDAATTTSDATTSPFSGGDGGSGLGGGTVAMVDALHVKLLSGSPFYDRQQLHLTTYVGSMNADKLLFPFRKTANLAQASGVTAGYPGWDSTTLKGHLGGHFLSAASRLAAETGNTALADKVTYMVSELAKVQTALGGQYVAGFPATGSTGINAPYYVHHKVLAGLIDAYYYLGNRQALTVAENFAKYFSAHVNSSNVGGILVGEIGGMTDALTELYSITKNIPSDAGDSMTYLKLAGLFVDTNFDAPLAQNQDQLKGLHGNMHVALMMGLGRYANVTAGTTEASASANFWSIVTSKHSYVNGGNTVHEWFQGPGVEAADLPYSTTESCNTNNMLKLTARLFERSPRATYADYFERALYNHILPSVAPDTGMVTYFTPMHGNFRTYLDSANASFCCQGTGLENTGRYNEGIYFQGSGTLWVNLYIPSEVNWSEKGIVLREEGYVPVANTAKFTVTQAASATSATIQFRIPKWISGAVTATVNGQAEATNATASSYFALTRTWQTGDVVTLTLPAALRIEHAQDVASTVAAFYGPVLLAAELGKTNMPSSDVATSQDANKAVADVTVPDIVNASTSPADWLTLTDATTLTFQAHGAGAATGTTFAPLYAVHHQRYSTYFTLRAQ